MIFADHAHAIRIDHAEVCGMDWRLSAKQKRKYEAADRLGLTSRLLEDGWPGLTAQESGRIGAMMRHPPRNEDQQE